MPKCGKNQWGGYCPPHMSYNSGRLRNGQCTKWQNHIYETWCSHGKWVHGFGDTAHIHCYSGVFHAPCFYDFANFYRYCVRQAKRQGLWNAFKRYPGLFCWDKDLVSKSWAPGSITLMFKSQNALLVQLQNPQIHSPSSHNKTALTQARPVLWCTPTGITGVCLYGTQGTSRQFGIPNSTVCNCCTNRPGEPITRGKWKGWSFSYI